MLKSFTKVVQYFSITAVNLHFLWNHLLVIIFLQFLLVFYNFPRDACVHYFHSTENILRQGFLKGVLIYRNPVDTGRKLNVHKMFRRRPGRLLNVLCTFNLRPVSTGNEPFNITYARKKNTERKILKIF